MSPIMISSVIKRSEDFNDVGMFEEDICDDEMDALEELFNFEFYQSK